MENSWKFLKKLKTVLSYNPAIPLLSIYQLEKIYLPPHYVPTEVVTIAKTWKQPNVHRNEWIKRMWCVDTHTHTHTQEYYSAISKMNECQLQQHE